MNWISKVQMHQWRFYIEECLLQYIVCTIVFDHEINMRYRGATRPQFVADKLVIYMVSIQLNDTTKSKTERYD